MADAANEALFVQFYDTDDNGAQSAIGDLWVPLTDLKQGVELVRIRSLSCLVAFGLSIHKRFGFSSFLCVLI